MNGPPRGPFIIAPGAPPDTFPDASMAMDEPDGLLAIGGDLSEARLLAAYQRGIFPWYSDNEPILWWTPDPRCVLYPADVRVSRRLARTIRSGRYEIRLNTAFDQVVHACAGPRSYTQETWITSAMAQAYGALHAHGHAHSIEAWRDGELAGGLYGVGVGRAFFGESMFSAQRDASKVILAHLGAWLENHEFGLIDCQVASSHLMSMGATLIPRSDFNQRLRQLTTQTSPVGAWTKGQKLPCPAHLRALQ
ncbi:MAG: leucyl/phenylalanyl-tRNA--protein transferase [Gammaproteobacteria bacterium]